MYHLKELKKLRIKCKLTNIVTTQKLFTAIRCFGSEGTN